MDSEPRKHILRFFMYLKKINDFYNQIRDEE